jgi:cyclic beta-1,2-glucan synthetase
VWDAPAPYLEMRGLGAEEHEVYDRPTQSGESGTLYEHCVRALDRACTVGAHGLPLMGSGDWNDGMSRVGIQGKGESIWLAWFLVAALRRFAEHAERRGDLAVANRSRERATAYAVAVERDGWDGEWYRRAYFDDGTPLGTATDLECQIDSIAQSWAVISGAGDPARARQAMGAVGARLVNEEARTILLLTPPFDETSRDPGYIKGYVPGVRENGAQYTHAALWTVLAEVGLGHGDRAFALMELLNPLTHARTRADADRFKAEPYVVVADVYSAPGHEGRAGWSWYTGSASWSYRTALEGLLGFTKRGDTLAISPCIPRAWETFSIEYRFGEALYAITVRNPDHVETGVASVTLNGIPCESGILPLDPGKARHDVVVDMGVPFGKDSSQNGASARPALSEEQSMRVFR